ISAGLLVPRRAPLTKALEAARRCGVPANAVTEAAEAGAAFERLVERHAGDRASFDAMVRGLQPDEAQQIHLKDRRAAFRAASAIWGLSAQATYACIAYHESETSGMQDSVLLTGHAGLQKLRPDVGISIGYQWAVRKSTDDGTGVGASIPTPSGPDFLEEFS